jgi:hypothetical protein
MSLLALRQYSAEPSGTGTVLTIGGKFAIVCKQTQEAAEVERGHREDYLPQRHGAHRVQEENWNLI